MNKILVFISAPYSKPGATVNVNRSAQEYDWIWQTHKDRVIPISMVVASHMQDLLYPQHYDDWLKLCIEMMKKCDILYVMPGESSGKEEEIRVARAMGIPIVYSREQLVEYMDAHPELFDGEVARLRREIGHQLYEAKREGFEFANIKVREGVALLNKGGRAAVTGAAGLLTELLTGPRDNARSKKNDREENGNPR